MSGMRLHEAFHFLNVTRDGIIGKRRNKDFTILHALDAVIENREHAAVSARTDQSSESLLQRENRFRNLIFTECVAAFFLQRANARGAREAVEALRPPPADAGTRAATMGPPGTANGRRSTITQES